MGGATRRKPRSACREDSESPASSLAGIPFTARPPFTTPHRTGRRKADGGQRVMMLTVEDAQTDRQRDVMLLTEYAGRSSVIQFGR
ncbi:hypothetical protein D6T51_14730 [Salmonella enterica subsp. enterica serovar Muenchen]|nr:hypothetical protein [Salmonella enterica subsp. enterica serovar Muenchen]